jgi:predicted P-loop ATPase/GTPase
MPAAPVVQVKPQIVSMVEPVIPVRVQDDVGRIGEVSVDLTIRADGSVAAVTVLPPAPRQIQRFVVAALEQWRYEPLPAERVHRVQLVFNSER